jgi:uncharacterized CHY-type Zn-finger protein
VNREVDGDPVVIECPECGTLGLCQHRRIEERVQGSDDQLWKPVNDIYFCGACHQMLLDDALENDGTGVLHAKKWICSHCHTPNAVLNLVCSHCKAWKPGLGDAITLGKK